MSARSGQAPQWRLTLLLAGLAMFGPFSIDTFFPAFRQMAGEFGVDKAAMQQTISIYLLAYAAMSVLHGPFSDALGRRRVILGGLLLYTAASVGCALAPDLRTLLVFRALQGTCAGVGVIVGRAAIRDLFQGADAQKLMSQVAVLFGIAPAIAPIIGGWLLGWGRWPLTFWFLVGFGVVLLAATWRWFPETLPPDRRVALSPRPLLRNYLGIGFNPSFQRLAAACAFNFGAVFLYIASAPEFVMNLLGMGEGDFAWLFIPTVGGMTLGAFLSGRLAGRVGGARQIGLGFACGGVAALANIGYNLHAGELSMPWAVVPIAITGFGASLAFPLLALGILDLYPQQRGTASSLQAFTQLVLNAALAGLVSPWLSRSGLWLALGAATCTLLGWSFWQWERHATRARSAKG